MKDLILRDPNKAFSVRDFLRKPYFTYEYKGTADLLMEMKEYAVNLAIVLDEYGATAGMITLEDLLKKSSERSVMNTMPTKRKILKKSFRNGNILQRFRQTG